MVLPLTLRGLFNSSNYFEMSTKCRRAFMSRESITGMIKELLPGGLMADQEFHSVSRHWQSPSGRFSNPPPKPSEKTTTHKPPSASSFSLTL